MLSLISFLTVMLSLIALFNLMLSVVMLNEIILGVVAPHPYGPHLHQGENRAKLVGCREQNKTICLFKTC
jgi:hypothetical protein